MSTKVTNIALCTQVIAQFTILFSRAVEWNASRAHRNGQTSEDGMGIRKPTWLTIGLILALAACSHAPTPVTPNTAGAESSIDCDALPSATPSSELLGRPGVVSAVIADNEWQESSPDAVLHLSGAKVLLTPEPGTSHRGLGHTLQCRIRRRMERATTPTDADPLAVGHVQVEVSETEAGFMVLIQSPYAHEAHEILRRANNLLAKETEQSHDAEGR